MGELIAIEPKQYGLEEAKATELLSNLPQIVEERKVLEQQYDDVVKLDINDPKTAKTARELRLKIRDNRTKGIAQWHKTAKEFFLRGGQFVDAIKNKEIAINERMESNLDEIEKHFENRERERKDALNKSRLEQVSPYLDSLEGLVLSEMEEDVFQAYLYAKKTAFEAKVAAEAKEKADREEAARIEAERLEQQRKENERLKAEAEERESQHAKERAEAAAKLAAEKAEAERILAEQKAAAEAKLEEERKIAAEAAAKLAAEKAEAEAEAKRIADELAAEKAKSEAERVAAEAAKAKEDAERQAKELADKKAAEKLAKAPVKKQLNVWVDSFSIESPPTNSEVAEQIKEKFEAFKAWSKNVIENM